MRKEIAQAIIIFFVAATAMLGLSACGSEGNQPLRISGQLVYGSDAALPKAATARVSMIEHGEDGGDKRIVAERSLHDLGRKPIAFSIDVARNLINLEGRYGLRAEIVNGEGHPIWHTRQPAAVKPLDQTKNVALKLDRVARQADATLIGYECADGFHFAAARSSDEVMVQLGKRRLTLRADPAGNDQQRYSDEHGNRIELTGTQATLRIDGNEHRECRAAPEKQPAENKATENT